MDTVMILLEDDVEGPLYVASFSDPDIALKYVVRLRAARHRNYPKVRWSPPRQGVRFLQTLAGSFSFQDGNFSLRTEELDPDPLNIKVTS